MWRRFRERLRRDGGMATAEYAVGIVAVVAFALVLLKVLTSPQIAASLMAIVTKALSQG